MAAGRAVGGHMAFTVVKQREMTVGAQLAFSWAFCQSPRPRNGITHPSEHLLTSVNFI